jgi:acetyltransferase-like isoleucine patch superfamily enzyme
VKLFVPSKNKIRDNKSMQDNSRYFSKEELIEKGFQEVGSNVQVSRQCSLYISEGKVGSNVRIDDFCILKGAIYLGSNIHLAPHSVLSGSGGKIIFDSCSGCSNGVCIYTATDDYLGNFLGNPTIPEEFKRVRKGDVKIGKAVILGTYTVVLPGVEIADGVSTSAYTLVRKDIASGSVCMADGLNVKVIKIRDVNLLLHKCNQVLHE